MALKVRIGGSRHTGLAAPPHKNIQLMRQLNMDHTPHCCRHTCISMLTEADVSQTVIKKIVGHSGAMTLTEKVYTHLNIKELVDAINSI